MDTIERYTELFDLFGQTGTCAICQEDLQEGERVRAIQKCQHMFHRSCIDAWLERKEECPMCRTPLADAPPPAANTHLGRIQILIQTLNNIQNILVNGGAGGAAATDITLTVPSQSHSTVSAVGPEGPQMVDRYILSYCIADGIQRRLRDATTFNLRRNQMRDTLENFTDNGVRPIPIDLSSLTALKRCYTTFRSEVIRRLNLPVGTHLRLRHSCIVVRNRLSQIPAFNQFWANTT